MFKLLLYLVDIKSVPLCVPPFPLLGVTPGSPMSSQGITLQHQKEAHQREQQDSDLAVGRSKRATGAATLFFLIRV